MKTNPIEQTIFEQLQSETQELHFQGKSNVLNTIHAKENQPSLLSRLLNYEVSLPVSVAVIAASVVMVVSITQIVPTFQESDPIYVISEGGEYESY